MTTAPRPPRAFSRVLIRTGIVVAALVAALLIAAWLAVPDLAPFASKAPERTNYMRLRAEARSLPDGGPRLAPLPLEQISPLLGCAVVMAEDRTFFEHGGLLWAGARAAALALLAGKRATGGSTITQQLARNIFLSPERTLWRKLREALIARRLETALGKRRILELYLGSIEWGDGVWGAEAAAQHWLGKHADALDAFDASFLAALIAAPRTPLVGDNLRRMARVQGRVLAQLFTSGLIDEGEFESALSRAARLRSAGETLPPAATHASSVVAWADVLATGCGREREFANLARLREQR